MKCPYCGAQDKDHVLDSRPIREGESIKRRRECDNCRGRFTTFEEIEELRLMVAKTGGRSREPFDRNKLRRAIEIACRKRPVTDVQIAEVVEGIERGLYSQLDKEVTTAEIGELVMDRLKALDKIAYVRFASVYLQFEDAEQFRQLVAGLTRRRAARAAK
jgi:transcriptional repressor NrdR